MTFVVTLLAAAAGAVLATLLRLPAGSLIGAMLGVGILKAGGVAIYSIPAPARFAVYCAVGWMLGETFTPDTLRQFKQAVLPILVCVGLFVVFGLLLGWALWRLGGFDPHTAFLSTAPGGIAQIGVLSAESRANVPVVLAVHVLRITSVIFIMSIGMRWLGERGYG
jgi:membrane AbrB-like protein